MLKNKRNAKIIAVTVVAFFLLGIVGIVVSQSGNTYAAPSSKIGKIDRNRVFGEHPGIANFQKRMQDEVGQAQKDFDEKTKSMNDQQKQDYYNQVQERLAVLERDMLVPINDEVDAAIKSVADSKNLEVVFDSRNVYYGGVDVTEDVIKQLKKGK